MSSVSLRGLSRRYGDVAAVQDLDLEVNPGELVALLGPSGCGKTTTLRMIAGLLTPTGGDVLFDGQSVLAVPAERRGAVMVFQKHLLFPHLNVADNVGFGLRMQGVSKGEIDRRVGEMLELVRLPGMGKRRAQELSGGQQQRVALARALVVRPRVLLLDEPLANLDANLRLEMRELIRSIQQELHMTTLFVTHDQEEAVMLADRVALLFAGRLQQFAPPQTFYERPCSVEVAKFFRNENLLSGYKQGSRVTTALGDLELAPAAAALPDGPVALTVRPEHVLFEPADGGNQLPASVAAAVYMGTHTEVTLRLGTVTWQARCPADLAPSVRSGVVVQLPARRIWVLPAAAPTE